MKFKLSDLLTHPCYHQICSSGRLTPEGDSIEIDESQANKILQGQPPLNSVVEASMTIPISFEQKPVPKEQWPQWAILISKGKSETDKGVGDTAARTLGLFGGDLFKSAYKKLTGKDCGCCEQQESWNTLYPYVDETFRKS